MKTTPFDVNDSNSAHPPPFCKGHQGWCGHLLANMVPYWQARSLHPTFTVNGNVRQFRTFDWGKWRGREKSRRNGLLANGIWLLQSNSANRRCRLSSMQMTNVEYKLKHVLPARVEWILLQSLLLGWNFWLAKHTQYEGCKNEVMLCLQLWKNFKPSNRWIQLLTRKRIL